MAIESDTVFTIAHTGAQDDGSFIRVYFAGFDKDDSGQYLWWDYPHEFYLLNDGTFLDDWMDPEPIGIRELRAGESVRFTLPTDQYSADAIYRVKAVIYYPVPGEEFFSTYYLYYNCKVDETGVAEALANGATDMPARSDTSTFTDVPANLYCAEPVRWAVEQEITAGTGDGSTFSPNDTCTTAQILTFLWRARGRPSPAIDNPFSNIEAGSYYYDAVLWAYEQGLVSGDTFDDALPCTRSQTVTYFWKLAGSPQAQPNLFTDIPSGADYDQAVSWAVEEQITAGTGDGTTFSPDGTCTRGEIVTFLWRDLA